MSRFVLLTDQLNDLRQRGVDHTFDQIGNGPLKLDVLFKVVEGCYSELWRSESQLQQVEAIRSTLRDAIGSLPTHNLPDTRRNTMSWQEAALILFKVDLPLDLPEILQADYKNIGQEHAKLARYVRDVIDFPDDDKKFQRVVLKMRKTMAMHLLRDEPNDAPDDAEDVADTVTGEASAADSGNNRPESPPATPVQSPNQQTEEDRSASADVKIRDSKYFVVNNNAPMTNHWHND